MNIFDEIEQACLEVLQEKWDRNLIFCWKKYPYQKMDAIVKHFMAEFKVDTKTLDKLKRIPFTRIQDTTRISRFIPAYLPVLNTHLWNGNKTDDELVAICSHLHLLKYPCDATKDVKDKRELKQSKTVYEHALTEKFKRSENRAKYGRRNWEAAKP